MESEDEDDLIGVDPPNESWQYSDAYAYGLAGGLDVFCERIKALAIRLRYKDSVLEKLDVETLTWMDVGRPSGKVRLLKSSDTL